MPIEKSKKILLAPLDWGMGHTTRCIPLIRYLRQNGHRVVFAGNDTQRAFIKETFGAIDTIHIDGYNVKYSAKNNGFRLLMLSQLPRLAKTIRRENEWLNAHAGNIRPDGIISDNRYGLYHSSIPSVIITHQLCIQTGMGNRADGIVQKMHYKFLERFNRQWIVDAPGAVNISGRLAHPEVLPAHSSYIGLLSQFSLPPAGLNSNKHLLILLSGPEPQRTVLSGILWEQLKGYAGKVVFVSGSNESPVPVDIPPHISYYGQITRGTLLPLLQNAAMVICRSGYSTLMDLIALQKKAIVIPTPGQTEQEYLGAHLHRQGIFYCARQKGFGLTKAITESKNFPFGLMQMNDAYKLHEQVLGNWLGSL